MARRDRDRIKDALDRLETSGALESATDGEDDDGDYCRTVLVKNDCDRLTEAGFDVATVRNTAGPSPYETREYAIVEIRPADADDPPSIDPADVLADGCGDESVDTPADE